MHGPHNEEYSAAYQTDLNGNRKKLIVRVGHSLAIWRRSSSLKRLVQRFGAAGAVTKQRGFLNKFDSLAPEIEPTSCREGWFRTLFVAVHGMYIGRNLCQTTVCWSRRPKRNRHDKCDRSCDQQEPSPTLSMDYK